MNRIVSKKQVVSFFCIVVLAIISNVLLITASSTPVAAGFDLLGRVQRFFGGSRPQGVPSGRTRGGGSRPSLACSYAEPQLIEPSDKHYQTTISDRPTFWLYIQTLSETSRPTQLEAEISIFDENYRGLYRRTFTLPRQSGIVNLQWPLAVPLENNKVYKWRFSIICDPRNRIEDVVSNGLIEKVLVSKSLSEKIKTANSEDLVALYADEGLWIDMLTAFAFLGKTSPESEAFRSTWTLIKKGTGLPSDLPLEWVALEENRSPRKSK